MKRMFEHILKIVTGQCYFVIGAEKLKRKWKCLRNSYCRTKRKLPSGSGAKGCKQWYLFDEMVWTDPYITDREQNVSAPDRNLFAQYIYFRRTSNLAEEEAIDDVSTLDSNGSDGDEMDERPASSVASAASDTPAAPSTLFTSPPPLQMHYLPLRAMCHRPVRLKRLLLLH